jgi:hypothetical protein
MVQAYDKSGVDPEDLENAIEAYEGVHHILNDKDLVSWDIEQDIPDSFKLAMTALTAKQLLPLYPIGATETQVVMNSAEAGYLLLCGQMAEGQEVETVKAEYY